MNKVRLILFSTMLLLLTVACGQTSTPNSSPPSTRSPSPTSIPIEKLSFSWSSKEASKHIGERGTVCGPIVDTRYATGSNGKPTFLNFDRAYPNHTMVVVIWNSNRGAFPRNPQTYYKGKDVCATGLIESYKGKPEIVARDGDQLEIQR
jgi:DNA/RNA endonuclease YhcR with UshA esterase domain